MRSDLTDLERADHTARRAEIVRQKTAFAKSAKTESAERADKGQAGFEEETAKATGKSTRNVRRDKNVASKGWGVFFEGPHPPE